MAQVIPLSNDLKVFDSGKYSVSIQFSCTAAIHNYGNQNIEILLLNTPMTKTFFPPSTQNVHHSYLIYHTVTGDKDKTVFKKPSLSSFTFLCRLLAFNGLQLKNCTTPKSACLSRSALTFIHPLSKISSLLPVEAHSCLQEKQIWVLSNIFCLKNTEGNGMEITLIEVALF